MAFSTFNSFNSNFRTKANTSVHKDIIVTGPTTSFGSFAPNFYDLACITTDEYTVYTFTSTLTNYYTISYTASTPITLNILAVGGGGGGGDYGGAGVGAGGVQFASVIIPAGSSTINITVGSGGAGGSGGSGIQGQNTTVKFNVNSSLNLIAGGGGGGLGQYPSTYTQFGSGGGGGFLGNKPNAGNTNGGIINANGGGMGTTDIIGGGSGSGSGGGIVSIGNTIQSGGNGIKCTLNGIKTFTPSGTAYGTYYWGGGGEVV